MANYALCNLTIIGAPSELDRFAEAIREPEGSDFELQRLVPVPEDVEDEIDWLNEKWGMDGRLEECQVVRLNECELMYSFEAAWKGPDKAVRTLSTIFPTLHFSFRHADDMTDWSESFEFVNGQVRQYSESTFDDPTTKEYWHQQYEDRKAREPKTWPLDGRLVGWSEWLAAHRSPMPTYAEWCAAQGKEVAV